MKKNLIYSLCLTSVILLNGCGTKQTTPPPTSTEPDVVYTAHVIPDEIDRLAHVASFYASLSCMVADKNFATREGYTDTASIYKKYGYEERMILLDVTKLNAGQEEFPKTLFRYINELCPGRISPAQQGDIAEQLRREAM